LLPAAALFGLIGFLPISAYVVKGINHVRFKKAALGLIEDLPTYQFLPQAIISQGLSVKQQAQLAKKLPAARLYN